jgi:hypothetical protein
VNKNLSQNTNTVTIEMHRTLQSVVNLISKCLAPDIISIVFFRNNHLFSVSNDNAINNTETVINDPNNKHEEHHRFVLMHRKIKVFETEKLVVKTGKEIGFIDIGYEGYKAFSGEEKLLLENIASITQETIEKHLEAQKMVDVFTNIVHKIIHDLKNPFTSIALTTEVMKRKAEEAGTIEALTTKLQATNNRVFNHLEKLLQIFPAKRETFKLQITKIDVNALLDEIRIENFNNLPQLRGKLEFVTDKEIIKEAIILVITHFDILDTDISELDAVNSDNFVSLSIVRRQKTKEFMHRNIDFAETNALLIAIKLIELVDGKVKHGYDQDDNSYRVQITLSV